MKRSEVALLLGLVLLSSIGCQSTQRPNFINPGPLSYQRAAAEQFDPFPNNDAGPPIVGARPPGFEQPRAEVQQIQPPKNTTMAESRWWPWNWF